MTIPAEKVFKKIQELVNENPDSLLNFDQEQESRNIARAAKETINNHAGDQRTNQAISW